MLGYDDQRDAPLRNPTYADEEREDGADISASVTDLQVLIGHLQRAQQANIRFEGPLRVNGLRVHVRWEEGSDERDGPRLIVTKIERAC